MSPFLYRLKSRPQAGQLLQYRRDKVRFLRALPEALRRRSRYRPYFATASGLADESYVLRAVPDLALCRGDLTRQMLGCRLLVLDHYGTTLHLALAANVPTLCFWNRREWGMEEDTERTLDALAGAGILQPGPEAAAAMAAAVWAEIAVWWASPEVQAARRLWLEKYVLPPQSGASLPRLWREVLRGL
jgi:putative transferase (TIGR04331 family)